MAISNGTLYIGGTFTRVQNKAGEFQPRRGLAAVDVATCELKSWTATTDGAVLALAVAGGKVYVGGMFLNVGGSARSRLASLDPVTGAVSSWNPGMNKPVRALVASSTTLYSGGDFTRVGTAGRPKLAAFSLASGALSTSWRPKAGAKVNALALSPDGSRVYVGGAFTTLNGSSAYPYLGAVHASTGAVETGFRPQSVSETKGIVTDARAVYVAQAGSGGHAAIWNHDGTLQRPIYQVDGDTEAVAVDGDSLFVGGHFTNYCVGNTGAGAPYRCDRNLERRKMFEISLSSGGLTSWAPTFDSPFGVISAVVDPVSHALFVGGDFTRVAGQPVAHLAKFVNN